MNEQLQPKGYVEPKEWSAITDSEKIERMREVIKNLQHYLGIAQADLHKMKNDFKNHSHLDGKIVVPYNEYRDSGTMGIASSSKTNYF